MDKKRKEFDAMKRLSPLKAIRMFCLECCGGSSKEVAACSVNPEDITKTKLTDDDMEYEGCPLWEFRFGHNPKREKRKKGLSTTKNGENLR